MRAKKNKSYVVWFTGLSGSGKTTLAIALDKKLKELGYKTYILDGDSLRNGLNKDLTFSPEDRSENIRRIYEVAYMLMDAGVITLVSAISPYISDRENAKLRIGEDNFVEVYVSTALDVCERRDSKGLYKKARQGLIKNFTGIGAPYETPKYPDMTIDTSEISVGRAIELLLPFVLPIER